LDLSWLEALAVTVEHGSFQTAAHKLGVSRATLRNRVEALESHVGLPLLVRTVRGVELTDAGEPFLARARALLAEAAALARFADERAGEVTGELRIRVPAGMPSLLHVLALSRMRRRYPGVRIRFEVHADPTADVESEADFVLHFCPRVTRGDFHTVRLWSFPVRLIASPAYLAERGAPRGPEELKKHALLSWVAPGEDGMRWPLRAGGWLSVDAAVCSPDIETVRGLATAGLGIAFVPDPEEVLPLVSHGDVVPVLPDVVGKELSLWILIPAARADARRTRAVVEITKDIKDWVTRRSPHPH
jgi:DNA-binding transcriptional LysR family regulator